MDTAGATGAGSGSVVLGTGDNVIGRVKITDAGGTDIADVLNLATNDALAVAIVDATGAQITNFGSGDVNLIEVGGAAVSLGQKVSDQSIPVVLSDEQEVIVQGIKDDTADISANTFSTVANLGVILAQLDTPLSSILTELELKADLTETQPVLVTNGAGAAAVNIQDGGNSITVDAVNLDIRDLAFATDSVNIGAWLGSTIPTIGIKTRDESIPVVLAQNQEANLANIDDNTFAALGELGDIQVQLDDIITNTTGLATEATLLDTNTAIEALGTALTGIATRTSVADSAVSVTLLAANTSRYGATIANDSSAPLYVGLGATAVSLTSYTVRLVRHAYYEVPFKFYGEIRGIWATDPGDGAARITEIER